MAVLLSLTMVLSVFAASFTVVSADLKGFLTNNNKLLNDEMGFFSYFQEAVDRYNNRHAANSRFNYEDYEDLQDFSVQQRRAVAADWFNQTFYSGENSGSYSPRVYPGQSHSTLNDSCSVVEIVYRSGVNADQIGYICDYIQTKYPNMTLREFLAYCGFDVYTPLNGNVNNFSLSC